MKAKLIPLILILAVSLVSFVPLTAPLAFAETSVEQEAKLKAELEQIEKEKAEIQKNLNSTKQQSATIQRDVTLLINEINKSKLTIKEKNILIDRLNKDIDNKASTIKELDSRIGDGKESLAQLIKKANELDSYSMIEVMFGQGNLSEFFIDIDTFNSIKDSMRSLFAQIRGVKIKTEVERESLRIKQNEELDAKQEVEAQKRSVEKKESEKKVLLTASKNQEKTYEQSIKEKEAKANAIRSALFKLRDTQGIDFGTALEHAKFASQKTGVRAAFILAILQQESNLGQNVGTCNRAGDPPEKSWREIMPGPADKAAGRSGRDDQSIFLQLATELGLNPDTTPLSCPWGTGWGGAMGPSQFIPSTWILYKNAIATALGKPTANPWEPKDAFMATSLYMRDLGAAAQTYSAERDAACRYYSGRRCDANAPANSFYGDQVMVKATNIQENMIDVINDAVR